MVELLSMFTGRNHDRIFLSVRDATDRLGFSDWRAAAAAFDELRAVNLISLTHEAFFDVKTGSTSRARVWRLNWVDEEGKPVSPDVLPCLDHQSLSSKARKRVERRQTALSRYFKAHASKKFSVVDSTAFDARSCKIGA
jgi:hypothetical protein